MKHRESSVHALRRWAFVVLLAVAGAAQAAAPKSWAIIDLGALDPSGSQATVVNARGDVGGRTYAPRPCCPEHHAFLWQNGTMQLLIPPDSHGSEVTGITDKGTVLVSDNTNRAFLWKDGTWLELGFRGSANDINKSEAVVGAYESGSGSVHAYLYQNGVFRDLGTLGATHSVAWGVNDTGIVVGNLHFGTGSGYNTHAFVYQDGAMRDIGTLGGAHSYATDVNNHGTMVGTAAEPDNRLVAFIHDSRVGMRRLFDLPGTHSATAINNLGAVVGTIDAGSFLYEDGVVTRLESLSAVSVAGWTRLFPAEISDRGWIVGMGSHADGSQPTAFLLVPRDGSCRNRNGDDDCEQGRRR
jgi:probable HAF family extracellular repeat protein